MILKYKHFISLLLLSEEKELTFKSSEKLLLGKFLLVILKLKGLGESEAT